MFLHFFDFQSYALLVAVTHKVGLFYTFKAKITIFQQKLSAKIKCFLLKMQLT